MRYSQLREILVDEGFVEIKPCYFVRHIDGLVFTYSPKPNGSINVNNVVRDLQLQLPDSDVASRIEQRLRKLAGIEY